MKTKKSTPQHGRPQGKQSLPFKMNHADLGLLTVFPPSNDLGTYIRLEEENMAEERQGGLPSLPAHDPHFPQPPISGQADHLAKVSGQYLERPGLHGVKQTNVALRPGPDPFRQIPSLVGPESDQG